ncbi:hypothetical protein B0G93_13150 [Bacillus sp. V-88]|nr:hypothetical protein B1B00_19940 [Bacillus sp. DSM 27956]PRX67241.1 hypothetical protein B0G93_13150 [Bacillus sp. V-88]SLK24814.1 hypothetical protein SAMN06295884_13150 [Bacillus sp. V-88]
MGKRISWTKEKVITELQQYQRKGHPLNSRYMQSNNNRLLKAGKRYFNTWEKAVEHAGFNYQEVLEQAKKQQKINLKKASVKRWTNEDYVSKQRKKTLSQLKNIYSIDPFYTRREMNQTNSGLLYRANKYFGSLENALNEIGVNYKEIKKESIKKWKDNFIIMEIERLLEEEEPLNASYIIKNHRQLYRACVNYFESWGAALYLVGVDYEKVKSENQKRVQKFRTLYSKEYVISELIKVKRSNGYISRKTIREHNKAIEDACYNRFGSLKEAIEQSGFRYETELEIAREEWLKKQLEVQLKWSKEDVIFEIKNLHNNGERLNSSYARQFHSSLYDGACNRYGSWEDAVTEAGIEYDKIREDRYQSSRYGMVFEKIVDDLLLEVGINYQKYQHDRWNPDYVIKNNIWIDAKLSQWGVFRSKTIQRYKEHCSMLFIIYLRGRRGEVSDIVYDGKVRFISVYYYIKQLPLRRRYYYQEKLSRIEAALSEFEDWK